MVEMAKPVEWIVATRNVHKIGEIRSILGAQFRYWTLADFPRAPAVVEDAGTFGGNATKKAVQLARWLGMGREHERSHVPGPSRVLADDSGLEVDALKGAPGVHSARFAALDSGKPGNSSDADNNAKLLCLLKDVPIEKRTARFRCVVAVTPVTIAPRENESPVCGADEFEFQTQLFEGTCEGQILFAPRGRGGFGYDPLFQPNGFEQSFAELGNGVKNDLSHRAKALAALKTAIERGILQ